MKRLFASLIALTILAAPSLAQIKKPTTKKPTIGTLGTAQMKGGEGAFGTTYTLTDNNGYIVNTTLVSAEYSVTRYNVSATRTLVPKGGEKLLILHFQLQNPKPQDEYFSHAVIPFSTVAADGKTRDHTDSQRLASAREPLASSLKPGQRFPEEVLAVGIVPAQGPVPKLIINLGRKGANEKVTRFATGTAPNTIKPLPTADADPSDTTGATALTEVPAQIGTTYPLGLYDFQVNSIAFVPGPIGGKSAGTGKRFLVVTLTLTNQTWHPVYTKQFASATLYTADDEKTTNCLYFKGKRDEAAEGKSLDPGETSTYRLLFTVPTDTTGKKLKLAEVVDNTGGESRALVFDLSGVQ